MIVVKQMVWAVFKRNEQLLAQLNQLLARDVGDVESGVVLKEGDGALVREPALNLT